MKINLSFIALLLLNLSSYSQEGKNTVDGIAIIEKKAHANMFQNYSSSAIDNYNITYAHCYWEIDPAINYISGLIRMNFIPEVSGFTELELDLSIDLTVDSVKYHNQNISFVQVAGDLLRITFPAIIPQNSPDSLSIFYQGTPGTTGFGSFVQSSHNGHPIIWTLSEPFGAKDWWPCKQNLNDKIDSIDIEVKVPQINRVASNGILVSEDTVGSDKIYHWKSNYPIAAYLVAIAVTNYAYYSDFVPLQNGTLEVLNYVYPENLSTIQTQTPAIIDIIQFYDSLTIEYPFANEKYGHAQFGWGGGMEHQTMSFMVSFSFGLMAHECAHQWFGDYITCGSWEDIWLNEGFATYFEGLTVQRFFPANWMAWKLDKLNNIISQSDGSVLCDDTTDVGRIFDGRLSYDKGGYLLHMLRWQLGDSAFFAGLKNYLSDVQLAANYAKTPDLQLHLETSGGQSLNTFFNQWYYNQGYPTYLLDWGQSGSNTNLTIQQSTSHSSVSFFEMPVPVKFVGLGTDTTIVFNNTFSGQSFNFTVNFPITSVEFDPEKWIISGNNIVLGMNDEVSLNNSIRIYPNPSSGIFNIEILDKQLILNKIEILDELGRLVKTQDLGFNSQKNTIDLNGFPDALYSLKLISDKGVCFSRFIKM